MPEKLPKPGKDVEELFDLISPRYDLLNHVFSFGLDYTWRWRTTSSLPLPIQGPILDGATGTGDLAMSIAAKYPDRKVVGCDFSKGMLKLAKQKAERKGFTKRIDFDVQNLTALTYSDNLFSAGTVAFGIRNVKDRPAALREFCRVIKPGGTLLVLDFSMPTVPVFAPFYRWYFKNVMPLIGDLFGIGKAYRYLYQSVDDFPLPLDFMEMMKQAGFRNVAYRPLTLGTVILYQGVARKDPIELETS